MTDNLDKQITFRLHDDDFAEIKELAERHGLSIADTARRLCFIGLDIDLGVDVLFTKEVE